MGAGCSAPLSFLLLVSGAFFEAPEFEEDSAPLDFIGTGTMMNGAINNGLERAAAFLDMTVPEVVNRVTITWSIDIGRAPGEVTVILRVLKATLVEKQLWEIVREQYRFEGISAPYDAINSPQQKLRGVRNLHTDKLCPLKKSAPGCGCRFFVSLFLLPPFQGAFFICCSKNHYFFLLPVAGAFYDDML